jgi:hypothetical protein
MFEHVISCLIRSSIVRFSLCDLFDNLQLLWQNWNSDYMNIFQFFILKSEPLILSNPSYSGKITLNFW